MGDMPGRGGDNLDAFFNAAGASSPGVVRRAAGRVEAHGEEKRDSTTRLLMALAMSVAGDEEKEEKNRDGEKNNAHGKLSDTFIAVEPTDGNGTDPDRVFVLIPAHIHQFVPWWGWAALLCGLVMLIVGIVLMPVVNLDRLATRLGDANEEHARRAVQQLVVGGNERTVKKLYAMATSERESIATRLRAVDTMSLIDRVPEVDRALLRLELSSGTNVHVREAAIAARKQREAYKTRSERQ